MGKQELIKYNNALAKVYDQATTGEFKWRAPSESNSLLLPYVQKGNEVLDIGIGTGQSSEALFRLGCKITGIDVAPEMLKIAQTKFPEFELHEADIEDSIPVFKNRTFDIVVAIGILEFVDNIKKVFEKVSDSLKPDGLFCFTYEIYLPKSKLQKWRVSELGKGLVASNISFLVHRYDARQIRRMFKVKNLKILKAKLFKAYLKSKDKIPVYYQIVLAKKY